MLMLRLHDATHLDFALGVEAAIWRWRWLFRLSWNCVYVAAVADTPNAFVIYQSFSIFLQILVRYINTVYDMQFACCFFHFLYCKII